MLSGNVLTSYLNNQCITNSFCYALEANYAAGALPWHNRLEVLQVFYNVLTTLSGYTSRTLNFFGIIALLSLFLERFYFAFYSIEISKARAGTAFIMHYVLDILSLNMSEKLNT